MSQAEDGCHRGGGMMLLPASSLPATSESFVRWPCHDRKASQTRIMPATVIKIANAFDRVTKEAGMPLGYCNRRTTAPPTSAEKSCTKSLNPSKMATILSRTLAESISQCFSTESILGSLAAVRGSAACVLTPAANFSRRRPLRPRVSELSP